MSDIKDLGSPDEGLTNITDEMVVAAWETLHSGDGQFNIDDMRAALSAALAAAPKVSVEQQFRDALEAMGFPEAQSLSAGECMSAAIAAVEDKTALAAAWVPIETAPRDGTWVMLAGGECHRDEGDADDRPVVAQWTNYRNGSTYPGDGWWQFAWYDGGYYGEYKNPTHWMALPAAPKE